MYVSRSNTISIVFAYEKLSRGNNILIFNGKQIFIAISQFCKLRRPT